MKRIALVILVLLVAGLVIHRGMRDSKRATSSSPPVKRAAVKQRSVYAAVQKSAQPQDCELEGYVLDMDSGAPIADVALAFHGSGGPLIVRTDDDGRFQVAMSDAGHIELRSLSASGYITHTARDGFTEASCRPGESISNILLYLEPDVEYSGLVLGSSSAGAAISVSFGSDPPESLVADSDGAFKFHARLNSFVEAKATDGRGLARAWVDETARATRRLVLRLSEADNRSELGTASISGRVVDGNGKGREGVTVRAAMPLGIHPRGEVQTSSDGKFIIAGLDPGTHVIWAACGGCMSARDRAATGTDITLVIRAGGTLAGQVIDFRDGRPIPSYELIVSRRRGMGDITLWEEMVNDSEGKFQVRDVPGETYRVQVVAQGYAPSPPKEATVVDGAAANVVITVDHGFALNGKVVDSKTGAAVAVARVSIESSNALSEVSLSRAGTNTDVQGEFVLNGVPQGLRSIRVQAAGYRTAIASGFKIDASYSETPTIKLSAWSRDVPGDTDIVGIGARLHAELEVLSIESVLPGGGADDAGLKAGDVITAIDGTTVHDLGLHEAFEMTRGKEGSTVELQIRRPGAAADTSVIVTRHQVSI
jgi:hypothetical protein